MKLLIDVSLKLVLGQVQYIVINDPTNVAKPRSKASIEKSGSNLKNLMLLRLIVL